VLVRILAGACAVTLALVGCAGRVGGEGGERVIVFAAASLTDVFGDIQVAFQAAHPDVDVELNLAGSGALREQILEGAPADVFASANRATMDEVMLAGETAGPAAVFARNELAIAVPAGNPAGVTGLAALGRPELLIGLCAAGVPCGDLARTVLAEAGVTAVADTDEPDVRALLTKIEAGELDAALVYTTDVIAAGEAVDGVALAAGANVTADYLIAPLAGAANPVGAARFIAYVRSAEGRRILTDNGFLLP